MKTPHLLPTSKNEVGCSKSMIRNDFTHLPTLPTKSIDMTPVAQESFPGSSEIRWVGREGGSAQSNGGTTKRVYQSVNESGHVVGQDHHRAKFTDHDIWLMRELRDEGMTLRLIAEKFETSKGTVHDICAGRRRGHTGTGQRVRIDR